MNKTHEPGEPTPEDLTQQYVEALGRLHGVREMFLAKQQKSDLHSSQAEDMFQRFETEQIEVILSRLEQKITLPWKAHPDTVGADASDSDATADTLIDPVGKKLTRFETTALQDGRQVEIVMTYSINHSGVVERLISTETEYTADALGDIGHPAFVPLDLPNGERINLPAAADEVFRSELDLKQAKEFVTMTRELIAGLAQVYNQKGWEIMLDTERTPNSVEASDYRAAYKIERLELD